MKVMTATEVARNFSAVLDATERGETIVVTRGSRRRAIISPALAANGAEIAATLAPYVGTIDDDFGTDIAEGLSILTGEPEDPWRD